MSGAPATEMLYKAVAENRLVAAFAAVGILLWISGYVSRHIFRGRIQGSAIAILGAWRWHIWAAPSRESQGTQRRDRVCRVGVDGWRDDAGFLHCRDGQ